ncbi:MAG: FHA domain-containing protein [Planctomycetota bacterium]
MASLTIMEPDKEPRTIALGDDPLIIGRSQSKCGLTFDFLGMSGRHCQITKIGETHKLIDLESANGTFVNNRSIAEHYLNHADRIALGVIILIFNNESQKQPLKIVSPKSTTQAPAVEPGALSGVKPPSTYSEPTFLMDGQKLREKMERLRSGKFDGVTDGNAGLHAAANAATTPNGEAIGATARDYAKAASATESKPKDLRWLFFALGFAAALLVSVVLFLVFKS